MDPNRPCQVEAIHGRDPFPPSPWGTPTRHPKHHTGVGAQATPPPAVALLAPRVGVGNLPNANSELLPPLIPNAPAFSTGQHTHRLMEERRDDGGTRTAPDAEPAELDTSGSAPKSGRNSHNPPRMLCRRSKAGRRSRRRQGDDPWEGAHHIADLREPSCVFLNNHLCQTLPPDHQAANVPAWDLASTRSGSPHRLPSRLSRSTSPAHAPAASSFVPESHQDEKVELATADQLETGLLEDRPSEDPAQLLPEAGAGPENEEKFHHPSLQTLPGGERELEPKQILQQQASTPPTLAVAANADQPMGPEQLWWRKVGSTLMTTLTTAATNVAFLAGLRLTILGKDVLALLDTGATNSFVSPRLVDELQLHTVPIQGTIEMVVATGETIQVKEKLLV